MSSESSDSWRCAGSLNRLMELELNILSALVNFIRLALPEQSARNTWRQAHSRLDAATLSGIFNLNLAVGVRHSRGYMAQRAEIWLDCHRSEPRAGWTNSCDNGQQIVVRMRAP